MSHENAQHSLDEGIDPDLVCAVCPWDRLCVEPPPMSKRQVDAAMTKARQGEGGERDPRVVLGDVVIAAMLLGGKDHAGKLCPVFALRLRGLDGRRLSDELRTVMRGWSDQAVDEQTVREGLVNAREDRRARLPSTEAGPRDLYDVLSVPAVDGDDEVRTRPTGSGSL